MSWNSCHVGISPIPPPAPLLDGPAPLLELREDLVFELPLLVRALDTLLFLPATPAGFARTPRLLVLRNLPPRLRLKGRPPFHDPDPERDDRLLGFLNVLAFEDARGRVCI